MGCARHHGHLRRGFALKQHAGKSLIHIGGNFPIMPSFAPSGRSCRSPVTSTLDRAMHPWESTFEEASAWMRHELEAVGISADITPQEPSGAFTLVASCGGERAEFCWRPHDDTLAVRYAPSAQVPFEHDAYISVPRGEGLYDEIVSQACEMLAA